ncbi:NAD(P)H-quinone oxidoreductase [Allohahella marinimesophila]|uniref:NAD(P)H-quinone oxidoreductase n=1 Tax=Allohahella marinimesophila TaxID=1054972 RepID=A0ABP7NY66_9GAMM
MKAITLKAFGGPEVMTLGDVDKPQAGAGQVLIKVVATSVNRADIVQRRGFYPAPQGESEILGLEVAGIVSAVGDGVRSPAAGDLVIALVGGGGYAEYAVAYAGHCIPLPENMDFDAGACICETYITAFLNVFQLGALADGDAVLLHGGGGGVNTAAIQICRALRPNSTIYVTASSGKLDRVAELGAHHVIDYKHSDFSKEIERLSEGKGVPMILDHIGADYLQQNLHCLGKDGRLVVIGVMSGAVGKIDLMKMMAKRQQIIGSTLRSQPPEDKTRLISDFREKVMPLFASSKLEPLIHLTFPLADASEAHKAMEESSHFGKLVLKVQGA